MILRVSKWFLVQKSFMVPINKFPLKEGAYRIWMGNFFEKTVENRWVDRVNVWVFQRFTCITVKPITVTTNRQRATQVFISCRHQGNSNCTLLRIETPFTIVLNVCNLIFPICWMYFQGLFDISRGVAEKDWILQLCCHKMWWEKTQGKNMGTRHIKENIYSFDSRYY